MTEYEKAEQDVAAAKGAERIAEWKAMEAKAAYYRYASEAMAASAEVMGARIRRDNALASEFVEKAQAAALSPAPEGKGIETDAPSEEGNGEAFDDGEAMRMAHSIMPGSGATFKTDEEIRESVRPHASDCARNNEPAMPAGKCDCTLRLKWTRYSEIAPKSPDELAGYEVQSRYSDEHGEWIYRHVPKAVGAGVDPFTIASSSQHAQESARAQSLPPLLPPEPPPAATPEQLEAVGVIDPAASFWARKLAKEPA